MAVNSSKQVKKEYNFKWVGRDKTGKAVEGNLRRGSVGEVRAELLRQSIQPLKIEQTREKRGSGGKIKPRDIMIFSRQMATMMQAGIAISESIGMQASGTKKLSVRKLLLDIKADIDSGRGFANALDAHPDIFSDMFRGLVHSGERSGTLEKVFFQLADYLEKTEGIKAKIKKAMIYPAVVLSLAVIISAVILIFVIPTFQSLFEGAGMKLPALTQMVVDLSMFVRSPLALSIPVVITVLIITFKKMVKNSETLRRAVHKKMLGMPVFGQLIILSNSAGFARTLATMYDAGSPIINAMQTVANSSGNMTFKDAILEMRKGVSIGQQLNFTMQQTQLFPDMVVSMVSIGEESGNLSDMLMKVAQFYEEEIDNTVAAIMSLIEPLLIVVLGVMIGTLVVAMYLPIFKMADAF